MQPFLTPWCQFRHWWVVAKLLFNLFVVAVLLVQMPGIGFLSDRVASNLPIGNLLGVRVSLVIHSDGGLAALLIPMVLSVYKPLGMTRYGWRKQAGQEAASGS